MKVAINIIPLHSAHKSRGIGYYTRNLLMNLKRDKDLEIVEFTNISEIKNADVIHYPWFDFFFHTLSIKNRVPTIVTIHDTTPLIFPKYYPTGVRAKLNFFLQKISLSRCKSIISDSENSKKDIHQYLKINESKINVIHLAADSIFKPLKDTALLHTKRKYKIPDNFLLYVGDANWSKNLPFLLQGFKELIDNGYKNLGLVLVGRVFLKNVENIDHPELESLKDLNRLINQYKLQDKVLRPGFIEDEDLVAFYNLATIYVQPSLYEGFGLPILQAFGCGTPVVSSDRGSLKEVGGDAAVYFNPTNLNQFKSIVSEILQSNSLQEKLSRLGFNRAAKFSWDKVIKATKIVYENVFTK